jgi:fibronectin-binding autotransporter adhesin
VIGSGGTLTLGGSAAATNNQANISANTLAAANAGMASTGLNNFSGVIGGTLAVTKFGAGTQILGGANTYSGATTIAAGTLKLAAANVLPSGLGKSDVTIIGNTVIGGLIVPGTLDLGGFNLAINGLNSTTGGIIVNTVPLSWNGSAWIATTATNTLTIGNNDASGAYNGALQDGLTIVPNPGTGAGTSVVGVLAVTKTGTGTQTLSGVNTYTGQTIIDNGTVVLASAIFDGAIAGDLVASKSVADIVVNNGGLLSWQNSDQIGDSVTIVVNAGGTVALSGAGLHEKFFNLIRSGGTYRSGRGVTVEITDPTWGVGVSDVGGQDTYGELIITAGNNRVWGDGGSNDGPGTLTVTTAGLSFSGNTGGVLKIASDVNAANAGKLFLKSNLAYDGTVNPGKIVNLTAVDAVGADTNVFGAQRGIVDLSAGIRTFNIADGVASPNGHIASDMIITADVINGGVIKTGAGEVVMAGATNLNLGLTINNGSVAMGGTVGTSFTLNAGGTFSAGAVPLNGTGTGAVTDGVAGVGAVNLDNSAATSVINGGSNLVFQFKGVAVDGVTGAGTDWDLVNNNLAPLLINATAASKITIYLESYITSSQLATVGNSANGFDPTQSYSWRYMTNVAFTNPGDPIGDRFAIDASGVWNGAYVDNAGAAQTGYGAFTQPVNGLVYGQFFVTEVNNSLHINYSNSAIPEPGSMLLAGIAALGMGGFGWRRRRRAQALVKDAESTANATNEAVDSQEMPSA